MTPKALSPEELAEEREFFSKAGPVGARGRRLLSHIAALEADVARPTLTDEVPKDPQQLLRTWLTAMGRTQKDFAGAINVTESAMSYYLSGRNIPLRSVRRRIEEETRGHVPFEAWPEEERGWNTVHMRRGRALSSEILADNAALRELIATAAGERGPNASCWACEAPSGHSEGCRFGLAARAPAPGAALLEQHVSGLEKSLENARAERDAALADNAALLDQLNATANALEGRDLSDEDETRAAIQGQVHALDTLSKQPHPGAALLERHEKEMELTALQIDEHVQSAKRAWDAAHESERALARARNEGLEKAAQREDAQGRKRGAALIRALKEPEQ